MSRFWVWWWEADWMPSYLAERVYWSVVHGGPVAWPGQVRCWFKPHSCDGYGVCCFCGAYSWCREHSHA